MVKVVKQIINVIKDNKEKNNNHSLTNSNIRQNIGSRTFVFVFYGIRVSKKQLSDSEVLEAQTTVSN